MKIHAGRRVRVVLTLAVAVATLAITAGTASAIIIKFPSGRTYSYQPIFHPGHPQNFDQVFSNLDYNGGPVMPSNTNYLIFWSPSGLSAYPAEYPTGLATYMTDLAHDSGLRTNTDSVSTQYNDAAGHFANYQSTFGGSFTDTDPFPANSCPAVSPVTNCLDDADLQTELSAFIAAHGLPRDLTHEYFLLLPPNVENCFDSSPNPTQPGGPYGGCSAGESVNPAYCAYHSNSASQPLFIYSNDPYVTGNGGCDDGNHPNGPSDGALEGGLSHEHNESITDPLPNSAWTDIGGSGGENGDKCAPANFSNPAQAYGTPLGTAPDGATYNQVVNGHFYWYQMEYSNAGSTCLQRQNPVTGAPQASYTSTAGGGRTLNFDGSSSTGTIHDYNWQFNDFPGLNNPVESTGPTISHTLPPARVRTRWVSPCSPPTARAPARRTWSRRARPVSSRDSPSAPRLRPPVSRRRSAAWGRSTAPTRRCGTGTSATGRPVTRPRRPTRTRLPARTRSSSWSAGPPAQRCTPARLRSRWRRPRRST